MIRRRITAPGAASAPVKAGPVPTGPAPCDEGTPVNHLSSPVPAQRQSTETALSTRSFHRTVDRALLHRAALGEVFLTDLVRTADTEFLAAAQLPRSHAYYGDHTHRVGSYDPVLLLEVVRQATIGIAHRFHGTPADHKFILTHQNVRVDAPRALRIGSRPAELVVAATVTRERARDGQVTGLDFRLELSETETGAIGSAEIGLRFRSPESYLELRSRAHAGEPLPSSATCPGGPGGIPAQPGTVARRDPRNVVVTDPVPVDGVVVADLVVPATHPSMFDHPQDHLPGMVLVEAARQLSLAAVTDRHGYAPDRVQPVAITSEYLKFAELAPTTRLIATTADGPGPELPVLVEMYQDGEPVARVTTTFLRTTGGAVRA